MWHRTFTKCGIITQTDVTDNCVLLQMVRAYDLKEQGAVLDTDEDGLGHITRVTIKYPDKVIDFVEIKEVR